MQSFNIRNPLSIIAMFCTITEGLCLYALPKLTESNQNIFVWFVILFPVILLLLFFYTIIKHHTKLYSPSDFETKDNGFVELFYERSFSRKQQEIKGSVNSQDFVDSSFSPFQIEDELEESYKKMVDYANDTFQKIDTILPKHKLSSLYFKQFNSASYLVDIQIKTDFLKDGKDVKLPFVIMIFNIEERINAVIAGGGVHDSENGDKIVNAIFNAVLENTK